MGVYKGRLSSVLRLWYKKMKPFCLQIESTNMCNLKCVMCPRQAMKRPIGFMDFDLFKKIIDETTPLDHVWLHHFGEPLLHPKLVDMIKYTKLMDIRMVGISTNGNVELNSIINSGLDFLIISIDGIGKAYERIRTGADWNFVLDNVSRFLDEKKDKPETWIQIIDIPGTNIDEAIKFWEQFERIDKIDIKKFDTWAHQVVSINKIKMKERIHPRMVCPHLWAGMVIYWDGTCVPCCRDYDGKIELGNANNENVIDIYNNAGFNRLRAAHMSGDFNNELCKDCVEWAEAYELETVFTAI